MLPAQFPQANTHYKAPPGYTPDQVASIPAWVGELTGGNMDGSAVVVVAWKPSPAELLLLVKGNPVFIGFLGGVPPHFVTAQFPGDVG